MKFKVFIEHGGLKKNREISGMSPEKLAQKSGISLEMIRQYEDETLDLNQAPLLNLLKLCRALDCDLPVLLTDTESLTAYRKYMSEYADDFDEDEDEDVAEDESEDETGYEEEEAQTSITEAIAALKRLSEMLKEKPRE